MKLLNTEAIKSFKENFTKIFQERGLRPASLSPQVSVDKRTVSYWLDKNNEVIPEPSTFVKLTKALKVNPQDLIQNLAGNMYDAFRYYVYTSGYAMNKFCYKLGMSLPELESRLQNGKGLPKRKRESIKLLLHMPDDVVNTFIESPVTPEKEKLIEKAGPSDAACYTVNAIRYYVAKDQRSKHELAEALGVSYKQFSEILKGNYTLTKNDVAKLAITLEIEPAQLAEHLSDSIVEATEDKKLLDTRRKTAQNARNIKKNKSVERKETSKMKDASSSIAEVNPPVFKEQTEMFTNDEKFLEDALTAFDNVSKEKQASLIDMIIALTGTKKETGCLTLCEKDTALGKFARTTMFVRLVSAQKQEIKDSVLNLLKSIA